MINLLTWILKHISPAHNDKWNKVDGFRMGQVIERRERKSKVYKYLIK